MLSIFLMEKRTLDFIIRNNKFLDECFFRWASLFLSFPPTNGTNAETIILVRRYNNVQNTTRASLEALLRTRASQSRGSRLSLCKASGRWSAFAFEVIRAYYKCLMLVLTILLNSACASSTGVSWEEVEEKSLNCTLSNGL